MSATAVKASQAEAWEAAREHRPATLAIGDRPAVRARVTGAESLEYDGGRRPGGNRYSRTITVSALASELGKPPRPGLRATVNFDGEEIVGRVADSGLETRGAVVSLDVVT